MNRASPASGGEYRTILTCAKRIEGLVADIQQAHDLGIEPGDHREPWSLDFQSRAVSVYFETMPADYESQIASAFDQSSQAMNAMVVPSELAPDWLIAAEYLGSVAKAIRDHPAHKADVEKAQVRELEERTPALMSYGKLGRLVHPEGLARLGVAAAAVAHFCDFRASGLSEEERSWLQTLSSGTAIVDMATMYGLSERSLYRSLSALWKRLGVDSRQQAVAVAVDKGWITSGR